MTKNEQFLNSLTGDNLACFLSIREEILATNSKVSEEIGAELTAAKASHASEIAYLHEALAEADARTAAATEDRDRLAKLLADASDAFDKGDVAKLAAMRASALQTEGEKKLQAALAKKAEAEAEIAALAK